MFSLGDVTIGVTITVVVVLTILLLGYVLATVVGEWRDRRRARRERAQLRLAAWRARGTMESHARMAGLRLAAPPARAAAGAPAEVRDPRPSGRRLGGRRRPQPVRADLPQNL